MSGGFRITAQDGPLTVLKVDGWMSGLSVLDLQAACSAVKGALVIDLTDLRFAVEAGVSLLKRLRADGARLVGAGLFLAAALS